MSLNNRRTHPPYKPSHQICVQTCRLSSSLRDNSRYEKRYESDTCHMRECRQSHSTIYIDTVDNLDHLYRSSCGRDHDKHPHSWQVMEIIITFCGITVKPSRHGHISQCVNVWLSAPGWDICLGIPIMWWVWVWKHKNMNHILIIIWVIMSYGRLRPENDDLEIYLFLFEKSLPRSPSSENKLPA